MSNKYIITNCNILYYNPDGTAICNDLMLEQSCYCKDRPDCVMKQIVKKCNKIIFRNGNIDFKEGFSNLAVGENFVARQILKLLDIQEVE